MGAKELDILRPAETVYGKPVGQCIYCGSLHGLSKEHIIPYWMAGAYVLPKSSCSKCAKITRGFEDNLAYTAFLALRRQFNVQSRSKGGPTHFRMIIKKDEKEIETLVPIAQMPPFFSTWAFDPPGMIANRAMDAGIKNPRFAVFNFSEMLPREHRQSGKIVISTDPFNHMRLAAKIALGFFHFNRDMFKDYEPILSGVVLTGICAPYFIGGVEEDYDFTVPDMPESELLHLVETREEILPGDTLHVYLVTYMHLFVPMGGPRFSAVTARKRRVDTMLLRLHTALPLPTLYFGEIPREEVRLHIEWNEARPKNLEATSVVND